MEGCVVVVVEGSSVEGRSAAVEEVAAEWTAEEVAVVEAVAAVVAAELFDAPTDHSETEQATVSKKCAAIDHHQQF